MQTNRSFARWFLLGAISILAPELNAAPAGTAFHYQGKLDIGGNPAQGIYDLRFTIYDLNSGGSIVSGPLTNGAATISNGLFTTALDFGAGVFTGDARWLEIAVRTIGTGAFTTLVPRQPLTPTPYAILSASASIATAASTFTGAIVDSQLSTNIPRLNSDVTFVGRVTAADFAGNGANVTNVNATTFNGLTSGFLTSLPPPGWIWKNQMTPMWCVSSVQRWDAEGRDSTNANDDWVTNVANAMFTNGMVAAGCDIIKFEAVNTAWIRDASGGLIPNPARFPTGFSDMLSFCHSLGVRVFSYIGSSRTLDETAGHYAGGHNPLTPLSKMYRDVLTNYTLGFDGLVIDFDVNDIDLETIRIGNTLANQAILDADSRMVDGSKANRGKFVLERALAPGSTPNMPAPVIFPYEAIYQLNVVGVPGLYQNYAIFSELLMEARMIMSYSWFVRPGVTPVGGGWNSSAQTLAVNKNVMSIFSMVCGTLNMDSGFGEHPASGEYGPIASVVLFTNLVFSSIFKDPGVIPGHVAWSNALQEVWVRPLGFEGSKTNAVLLINAETNVSHTISVTASMLGVPNTLLMTIQDVFGLNIVSNFTGGFSWSVPGTNMYLLKVFPAAMPYVGEFDGRLVISPSSAVPAGMNYPPDTWVLWSRKNSNSNTLYASLRDTATSDWLTNVVVASYGYTPSAAHTPEAAESPLLERRAAPVPGLIGQQESSFKVGSANASTSALERNTMGSVSQTNAYQYCLDLGALVPAQQFYRIWQTGPPLMPPLLNWPSMVPAITLRGNVGDTVQVDYLNYFDHMNASVNLPTETLTNKSQPYFDTWAKDQPPRCGGL